jgi:hypothetical protein
MDDKDVYDEPCAMCGEPIHDEDWLYDDRSVWPGEEQRENVLIHDRCAG